MSLWFDETLHPDIAQRLAVHKVHYRARTEHQDLVIFENETCGRVLALDGIVQTTEGDEFIYHEMLAHVPILAHGAARRVLIIGGGDGGMAREVLRHRSVESVTMVEIDRSVVELCRTHLPSLSAGAFDDPRLELVIDDGAAFVARGGGRWDVAIIDSTDPVGPGAQLFTESFYRSCKTCLAEGGVLVTQNGVPFVQGEELADSYARLRPVFADVWFYLAPVPTYQGGHMAFGWASDDAGLRRHDAATIAQRLQPLALPTRYYNADVHVAGFALPNCIREQMQAA